MSTTIEQTSRSDQSIHPIYQECEIDSTKEEIRLLKVYPGAGNETIRCELSKASLAGDCIYSALSYVWGNPLKDYHILINDNNFFVTSNLYQALRRIRAHSGREPALLWIDAICINQLRISERNQQVGLMGKIYSNCRQVLVWLGETSPANFDERCCVFSGNQSDFDEKWDEYLTCFEFRSSGERNLEAVSHCPCSESNIDAARHCAWFFRLLAEGRHYSQLPPICFPQTKDSAYVRLFNERMAKLSMNPWFKRLWTVQEAVLAPRVIVLFDSVSLPYDLLTRAKAVFSTQHLPASTTDNILQFTTWFFKFLSPVHSLRVSSSLGKRFSLLKLCLEFNESKATEDLDRVYSFLGLVSEWHGAQPIRPDYNASVQEVYARVCGQYITATSSLLPLAFSSWRGRYPDLPSWAVDWTASEQGSPSTRTAWADILPLFNACGSLPQRVSVQHNNILSLLSVEADWVSDVGDVGHTEADGFVTTPPQSWRHIVLMISLHQTYPSGCPWRDAWWRTLCADCCWTTNSAVRATSRHIDGLARLMTSQYPELLTFDAEIQLQTSVSDKSSQYQPTEDDIDMLTTSGIVQRRRKLFATSKGYIGLGNQDTTVGDKVFVLPGLRIPILLRRAEANIEPEDGSLPQGEAYSVVSECYVHGIMDGEAGKSSNLEEKRINIV